MLAAVFHHVVISFLVNDREPFQGIQTECLLTFLDIFNQIERLRLLVREPRLGPPFIYIISMPGAPIIFVASAISIFCGSRILITKLNRASRSAGGRSFETTTESIRSAIILTAVASTHSRAVKPS